MVKLVPAKISLQKFRPLCKNQYVVVWSVHGLMQLAQAEGLKVARQQLGRCNVAASSVAAKVLLELQTCVISTSFFQFCVIPTARYLLANA